MNISPAQVEALNAAVVQYVRDRPQSWRSGMIEFYIYSIQPERNSMTFSFWLKHRHPYQECCAVFGDTGRFMLFLCGTLRELGLEYRLPSQPVQIATAMDIGAGLGQNFPDMKGSGSSHIKLPSSGMASYPMAQAVRTSEDLKPEPPSVPWAAGTQTRVNTASSFHSTPSEVSSSADNGIYLERVQQATSRWVDIKAGDIAQVWRPAQQKFKSCDLQAVSSDSRSIVAPELNLPPTFNYDLLAPLGSQAHGAQAQGGSAGTFTVSLPHLAHSGINENAGHDPPSVLLQPRASQAGQSPGVAASYSRSLSGPGLRLPLALSQQHGSSRSVPPKAIPGTSITRADSMSSSGIASSGIGKRIELSHTAPSLVG
jgi:hypothetical protein